MSNSYPNILLRRKTIAHTTAHKEIAPKATAGELPPVKSWWHRVGKTPRMMHYNRLILLVVVANIAVLVWGVRTGNWWTADAIALDTLSNLVVFNITVAIVMRQQYVINALFWLATRAPTSWPLVVRWKLGKVYHFGGIHVGGAIMGTVWYLIFFVSMTVGLVKGVVNVSLGTALTTYVITALLLLITYTSTPKNRQRFHDRFEEMHRFGGWLTLLLFWVQTVFTVNHQRGTMGLMDALTGEFAFWALALVTFSIILPWLRLRKVPVEITTPSNHVALAKFNYGVTPFAGSATAISRHPLKDWHSFANVPSPGEDGFRLTISRAGDWTGQFVDDNPSHVWVKGIPTAGVANIELLFKRVVYVATGSGIGPCLPHLLANEVPSRLVWSTRNARETYGDDLVDEILDVQPEAIIWDTNEHGRPDLVKLAYQAYKEFDAEAVIIISNKKLTWNVVYGMESRGIPAYGAIWDS